MDAAINGTLLLSATGGDPDVATVGGVDERYIGVALALSSTVFNGTSFVLKKKGLIASDTGGTPTWARPHRLGQSERCSHG